MTLLCYEIRFRPLVEVEYWWEMNPGERQTIRIKGCTGDDDCNNTDQITRPGASGSGVSKGSSL